MFLILHPFPKSGDDGEITECKRENAGLEREIRVHSPGIFRSDRIPMIRQEEFPFSLECLLDGSEIDRGSIGRFDSIKPVDEIVDALL